MTPVPPAETVAAGPERENNLTTGPLEPGAPFGGRYRILRVLGAGGMGVVYQAWDEELGVAVALKVIRPEITADPYAARDIERRFKRELLLARQVTHKHVVRIHDLGEVDGIKYLTMPFVEGRDLAVIMREGALPVPRALHFARQIAAGLQAAHDAGVVHRDLKPENVMIDADDQALLMDFGISRSASGGGATMTAQGAIVGTLEYMAPEQGRGLTADHRADIYAFGLIVYDMIAGRHRLDAKESAIVEMMSRMQQPPAPLKSRVPQVPDALSAIVMRCLEPEADRRFATTAELVKALEGLDAEGRPVAAPRPRRAYAVAAAAIAATVVLLAIVAVLLWRGRAPVTPVAHDPVSVLIADFKNGTGDAVFEGTLEQVLTIGVEGASFITSYPRRDAQRLVAQLRPGAALDEASARLVSQREGIKVVLAGDIETASSGYTVTVRAIDPVPGTEIAKVTEPARDKSAVLDAVGRIAAKMRGEMGDTESAREAARETFTAGSLEAAREYSTAQSLANANDDEKAIEHYKRALELDPNFGRAHSGWASSAWKLGRKEETEQQYQKAFASLDRMTEREKFRTLGSYYLNIAQNYDKAIENYSALAAKYPADGAAHNNLAVAYFGVLNFEKAMQEGRRLLDIYPTSVLYRYNYALYAMYAGDFDTSAAEARKAVELNPAAYKAYLALAMSALASGNVADARAAYDRAARTGGPRGVSLASAGQADIAMYEGRNAEAIALLTAGIQHDRANRLDAAALNKEVVLAEARLAAGDRTGARAAVARLAGPGQPAGILVPAAHVLLETGGQREARSMADALERQIQTRGRAYAKLIEGQIALASGRVPQAVDALKEARNLADLWLVRFNLGIAYVQANAYVDALDELGTKCEARRGEATAVFLDDMPTYRYTAPLSYWLGRTYEGLGQQARAADSYRKYLAIRPASNVDSLAADARQRLNTR